MLFVFLQGCFVPVKVPSQSTQALSSPLQSSSFLGALQLIRRIDVPVRDIRWSDSGELVAIVSESSFYILRLDHQAVDLFLASGEEAEDDGLEDAFELLNEVSERVRTGVRHTLAQVSVAFVILHSARTAVMSCTPIADCEVSLIGAISEVTCINKGRHAPWHLCIQ